MNREDFNTEYNLIVAPPGRDPFIDGRSFGTYFRAWIAMVWYKLAWPATEIVIQERTT